MALKELELWQKHQAKYHYSKGRSAVVIAEKIHASVGLTRRYLKKIDPSYGLGKCQPVATSQTSINQKLIASLFRPTTIGSSETRRQGE